MFLIVSVLLVPHNQPTNQPINSQNQTREQVFSSVSTTVFSTYACDYVEDLDVSLLRADYSISCDHPDHVFYEVKKDGTL